MDGGVCRSTRRIFMSRPLPLIASMSLGVLALAAVPGAARADAVTDWNANAAAAAVAACIVPNGDPLHESRLYAMVHLAAHDAVNAIRRQSRPYAYDTPAPAGTSPEAGIAAAARDVLVSQIPIAGVSPDAATAGA